MLSLNEVDLNNHHNFDSQFGSMSSTSSFSQRSDGSSTPPEGYLTPISSISCVGSRRQSTISCPSNLPTVSLLGSHYATPASNFHGLLPLTPTTPFATDSFPTSNYSFVDMYQESRPVVDDGMNIQPLTPRSDHSPGRAPLAFFRKDTHTDLIAWSSNQALEEAKSCKDPAAELLCDDTQYRRGDIGMIEAMRQSSGGEEHQEIPLTGIPSDIFNLGAANSTSVYQSKIASPGSSYSTSPTTEAESFESVYPAAFSCQRGDSHDIKMGRIDDQQHDADLSMVEVVDASRNARTRLPKRGSTRRPRMRRSQITSRRVAQITGSSKSYTGSKRIHTCDFHGCERENEGFERIEHLTRHKQSVHGGSTNSCVFGGVCNDKKFSGRKDNLNAHYTKTHFFIDHPEMKGRRRRWVGRDEQEAMGLGDVTRECETQRGKELLYKKGLIERLPDGTYTEYHEKRS